MLRFPDIDPVAFSVGPVSVHWYGLAYVAGIGLAWAWLAQCARRSERRWESEQVADLVFYAALGAVLGGRLGYVLFYDFQDYLSSPAAVLAVWRGGMSFHGGVLGFVLALAWYARGRGRHFLEVTDFVVPAVPIGLALGRAANFVNQELWGAPTALPWGVVFTAPAAGGFARHPTQLYEAMLEGVVLFVVLNALARRGPPEGTVSAWFLILYALMRAAVELLREPDAHLGYLAWGWLTMGQLLSLPMLLAGLAILAARRGRRR